MQKNDLAAVNAAAEDYAKKLENPERYADGSEIDAWILNPLPDDEAEEDEV